MKELCSVEVKIDGKWEEIKRQECNHSELLELRTWATQRIDFDTSPVCQFRIKCGASEDSE